MCTMVTGWLLLNAVLSVMISRNKTNQNKQNKIYKYIPVHETAQDSENAIKQT